MDSSTQTRVGVLLIVLSVVGMVAVPAAAFSPIVDTETTNTATTSQVADGTEWYLNDSNASTKILQAEYGGDQPEVRILDPTTDETVETIPTSDMTETNASANSYNATLGENNFSSIPHGPGENVSVTVQLINDSTLSTVDSSNFTNVTNYVWFPSDEATIRIGQQVASNEVTVENRSLAFSLFERETARFERSNVDIAGSNSTLEVVVDNSTTATELDESVDGLSSATWAASVIVTATTDTGEEVGIPTYVNSAPADLSNGTSYAVYDASSDTLTVTFGDQFQGVNATDIRIDSNRGTLEQLSVYGTDFIALQTTGTPSLLGGTSLPFLGTMGLGFGLTLSARREDDDLLEEVRP